MEWIQALDRALRYIEENLMDEGLCVASVAKEAAYSPFYLQRMFSAFTDQSLGEYIRQRRLSVAGQALRSTRETVLTIALRYGYDSPESFQKAFRRFHGVTPSAARKAGVPLKYLSPLHIKVDLTGGSMMDYVVETMEQMTVIGLSRRVPLDGAFGLIPAFWEEYHQKGLDQQVCGYLGICFEEEGKPDFAYMIAQFCEPDAPVPEGFEKRVIAPHTWVRFRAVGALPDAIQKMNRQIFTEWLPSNTTYSLADGVNIEMYTEGDMNAPDYVSEIWLPVRVKA